jgi:hypothetical protein
MATTINKEAHFLNQETNLLSDQIILNDDMQCFRPYDDNIDTPKKRPKIF